MDDLTAELFKHGGEFASILVQDISDGTMSEDLDVKCVLLNPQKGYPIVCATYRWITINKLFGCYYFDFKPSLLIFIAQSIEYL